MLKKVIIFLLMWLLVVASFSQVQTDSINLNKDTATYGKLVKTAVISSDYFNYPSSDFYGDKGQIAMNEIRNSLLFAFPLKKKKLYLFNLIQYSYFSIDAQVDLQKTIDSKNKFHSIQYRIGILKVLPKSWKFLINAAPTIASDFKESIQSDDFIVQASTMLTKRSSPAFEYGFGVSYTTRYGNPFIIPLASIIYKKKKWLSLMILPAYISHYYTFNKNTRLGLKMAVNGSFYNASFNNGVSMFDLNRVSYSRINIGPDFQTRLFSDFFINIGTGIAMRNILAFEDDDFNKELEFNVDKKVFFNIGIKFLK
jgi:hypothetical protein